MTHRIGKTFGSTAVLALMTLTLATGAHAQGGGSAASTQDTQFLQDLGQDSNFEIKTSKLALAKSSSADVKQYARMVIRDHEGLKAKIRTAGTATKTAPVPADSMSSKDQSTYAGLKDLSGDAFDQAYIKELVKGNDQIQQEEKSESSSSNVQPVKDLAMRSAAMDTKHADKAKQLAQAHHVQS